MSTRAEPGDPVSPTDGQGMRCPACDYDLRGLSSENCPECGLSIVRGALFRSTIPWTYRDQIGRFRAYRQTVWLTVRHTKKLAVNVAGPVSLDDARRFRRATVLISLCFTSVIGHLGVCRRDGRMELGGREMDARCRFRVGDGMDFYRRYGRLPLALSILRIRYRELFFPS